MGRIYLKLYTYIYYNQYCQIWHKNIPTRVSSMLFLLVTPGTNFHVPAFDYILGSLAWPLGALLSSTEREMQGGWRVPEKGQPFGVGK